MGTDLKVNGDHSPSKLWNVRLERKGVDSGSRTWSLRTARVQKQDSALATLDCAVDTTTPAGEAMAHVLATFAQFERRLIGQRTREALAVRRKEGVRLGRPQSIPPKLARRIRSMRSRGLTLQAICDKLNGEGVPTPRGGSVWRPTSLRAVLRAR